MRLWSDSPYNEYPGQYAGIAPVIRQEFRTREVAYCEATYAYPRLGAEGILAVVWCLGGLGKMQARHARWLVPPGHMPTVDTMSDVPLVVVSMVGQLVARINEAESMPDLEEGE